MAIVQYQDLDPLHLKVWARYLRFEIGRAGRLSDEKFFTSLKDKYPRTHEALSAYSGKLLLARTLGRRQPKLRVGKALF